MLESDVLQPSADQGSDEGDYGESCPKDEELFNLGPDAEVKFMDGMEAQDLNAEASRTCTNFLGTCLCRLPRKVKEQHTLRR